MSTDVQTDGGDYNIPFAFFLKKYMEIMMTECLSHMFKKILLGDYFVHHGNRVYHGEMQNSVTSLTQVCN